MCASAAASLPSIYMTNLDSILKSRDFADKGPSSRGYGFSSDHVWMWELDCEESWAPKNWCFWTVVLERTLESLLDCKEIQPVGSKGNQSWIFIGRTDAEAETPVFWPPDAKNWLIGKDPDAGKDWRGEEKRMTEDEMVGWHHQRDGHEFELALGVCDGQGSLVCCSPWGRKESDMTKRLNWTELIFIVFLLCASLVVQSVKNLPAGDLGSIPGSRRSPWMRKWQPTPVFLPGAFNGQRSLQSMGSHRVRLDWGTNTFTIPGAKFCYNFPSYKGGRWGPKRIST